MPNHQINLRRADHRLPLLAVVVTLMLSGCGDTRALPEEFQSDAYGTLAVRVAEARTIVDDSLRLPGVTRATERSTLAFFHPGRLSKRPAARGATVRAGDVLAVLYNPSLLPAVDAAEAAVRALDRDLQQLDADVERIAALSAENFAPREQLDRIVTNRDAARKRRARAAAERDEVREQAAEAVLKAPFDGVVADVLAEPGDYIAAGQPVLRLHGTTRVEIELSLPEAVAAGLEADLEVTVIRTRDGERTRATLQETHLPEPGRPAAVVIALPNSGSATWQAGQAVHVHLPAPASSTVSVPLAAIVDRGTGQPRVFRVNQGQATAVTVQPGNLRNGWVAVAGDLQPGDSVVVEGQGHLLGGERIRVLP